MMVDGDFLFRHGDSSSSHRSLPKNDNFQIAQIDNLWYLHPGKAGGGTMVTTFHDTVHITLKKVCHNFACPQQFTDNPDNDSFLILIRDPVDRYHSAFNWAMTVNCNPDDTKETRTKVDYLPSKLDECRKVESAKHDERWVLEALWKKYKQNSSLLAEALCFEPNEPEYIEAENILRSMHHAKYFLTDWFLMNGNDDYDLDPDKRKSLLETNQVVGIVLEHGFDFEAQIRALGHWILDLEGITSSTDITSWNDSVEAYEAKKTKSKAKKTKSKAKKKKPKNHDVNELEEQSRHNRRERQNLRTLIDDNSHIHQSQGLLMSKLGECCMARYAKRDYSIIKDLAHYICNIDGVQDDCRDALASMYDRREKFLFDNDEDEYVMSCQDITKNEN